MKQKNARKNLKFNLKVVDLNTNFVLLFFSMKSRIFDEEFNSFLFRVTKKTVISKVITVKV